MPCGANWTRNSAIDAVIGDEVACLVHRYGNGGAIELRFFVVREFRGELQNRIFREIRWAPRADLPQYDFLDADLRLVKDIAEGKIY